MKIGVISDTHLARVTPWLEQLMETYFKEVDLVLHAGDMVGLEVYQFLKAWKVEAVQGNMDGSSLRELLPRKKVLSLGAFRIGLIHGWGSARGLEGRLRPEFSGLDCLVYGHSHTAANHREEGLLFFNPGSAAEAGLRSRSSVGLIHLNDRLTGELIQL